MVELAGHLEALLYCMLEVAIRIEIGDLWRGINAMSQMGQLRRFDRGPVTSGLLPIADILRRLRNQKDRQQGGLLE
jgi:hypothetical protein